MHLCKCLVCLTIKPGELKQLQLLKYEPLQNEMLLKTSLLFHLFLILFVQYIFHCSLLIIYPLIGNKKHSANVRWLYIKLIDLDQSTSLQIFMSQRKWRMRNIYAFQCKRNNFVCFVCFFIENHNQLHALRILDPHREILSQFSWLH